LRCSGGTGQLAARPGRPWLSVVEPLWLRRLFALRVHQLVRDGKALVVGWFVFGSVRFGSTLIPD
jgi:hypothetical protein